MKAFSVVGITKSGKTNTIENMIREIKRRGFSVGSIKEIHYEDFAMDSEGTNTYRHRQAGSELVTARGYGETDILYQGKLPVEEILRHYTQDYVVLEGVTDFNVPVILCAHDEEDIKKHKEEDYFKRVFMISGVAANSGKNMLEGIPVINSKDDIIHMADIIIEKVFDILPDFSPQCCSACGFSCRELCARILKGQSDRSECRIEKAQILLSVDGRKINMVPFVQNILTDSIKALVANLRGYKKGKKIEITINL
jgi:molybdopterin-guanine dinucleotide biosynthesis adapter protein